MIGHPRLARHRNKRSPPGLSPGGSDAYEAVFPMKLSSEKMRELRTALTVALGLAIASFGTAFVAAGYIAK